MPESLPAELVDLRERLQAFVEEIRPLARGIGGGEGDPVPEDVRAKVRERSKELGFFGMTQPREDGGSEAGPLAMVVARETLAAANTPLARYVFGPDPALLRRAEGDVRTRYLEPVLAGEKSWSFAFTESRGPDAPPKPTWAVRDGDDFVVTGRKSFVTGGATADFFATMVNIEDGGAPGPTGTAMLLIDKEIPGVTITRDFHSMEGGGHVELSFEQARVPQANILGAVGEGMPRAMGNISEERVASAATACGIAMWTVDFTTKHITGGPEGRRLADREGVRLRYSDMRIDTYAARAMLYRTARLLEAGDEAINEGAATKVFCTEVAGRVVDTAVQLVGGQALIVGHPLEALYRRVRSMRLAGGASDILRLTVARGIVEFDTGRL